MNFWECVWTIRAEFRDCFWTVWVEISGFYPDSSNINFRNVFGFFLESMESPLSLEFNHMPINSIWYLHNFLKKINCSTKCANCLVVLTCVV